MLSTRGVSELLGVGVSRLDWLERVHLRPRVEKLGGQRVWTEGDVDRVKLLHESVGECPQRGRRK